MKFDAGSEEIRAELRKKNEYREKCAHLSDTEYYSPFQDPSVSSS